MKSETVVKNAVIYLLRTCTLASVLLLSITVIKKKKGPEKLDEERVYFSLQSIMMGNQGRNYKQEPEADTMEEHCLLPCSHGFISVPSYTTQNLLIRVVTAHVCPCHGPFCINY